MHCRCIDDMTVYCRKYAVLRPYGSEVFDPAARDTLGFILGSDPVLVMMSCVQHHHMQGLLVARLTWQGTITAAYSSASAVALLYTLLTHTLHVSTTP